MKKTINIEGMTCNHCAGRVTKTLSGIGGISKVDVSLSDKAAVITLSNEISDELLSKTIEDVGYKVIGIKNL